jgi:hypothetical protein
MAKSKLNWQLNPEIFEERLASFLISNENRILECGKIPLIEAPHLFAH